MMLSTRNGIATKTETTTFSTVEKKQTSLNQPAPRVGAFPKIRQLKTAEDAGSL
jgi:hypothetical protein